MILAEPERDFAGMFFFGWSFKLQAATQIGIDIHTPTSRSFPRGLSKVAAARLPERPSLEQVAGAA